MKQMPALFIGHGSPMNAVEQNIHTGAWRGIAASFPRPEAILCMSAHWYAPGFRVSDTTEPQQIYDMYGFPSALYALKYPARGLPELAGAVVEALGSEVTVDNTWGLDHGAWSVLNVMYPEADIPVVQLGVNRKADAAEHFRVGAALRKLRQEGVLLLGSGNVVHNLRRVDFEMEGGFDWATEFDAAIRDSVLARRFEEVLEWQRLDMDARLSVPMPDHYLPLPFVLGAAMDTDRISVFNDSRVFGSLSMTSYLFTE